MKKFLLISIVCICGLGFLQSVCAQAGLFDLIEEAMLKEDYRAVNVLSQQALSQAESDQEQQEAAYYLALSDLYQGSYVKAREIFQGLADETQDVDLADRARIGVINSYSLAGEYREALKRCNEFLKKRADSNYISSIFLRIARLNLRLSHWEPARRYLQAILRQFPDSLEATSARQLLEEKKFFSVQVGAFLDKKYADDLALSLREQGQYGYIVETVDKEGRVFYRVRVGELSSLNAAKHLKERLSAFGLPTIIYP